MPGPTAPGSSLAPPVNHGLGRVQVEGHLLARLATEPAVELVAAPRRSALDRADVRGPEPARQLARGRRRRRLRDRAQRGARLVSAARLDVVEALRAGQLRLGD